MSVSLAENNSDDVRVIAGDKLVLRLSAYDPNGIKKIYVQCFQSAWVVRPNSSLLMGELAIPPEDFFSKGSFEISIEIPENAALGKWGVQVVEFTNLRGYK